MRPHIGRLNALGYNGIRLIESESLNVAYSDDRDAKIKELLVNIKAKNPEVKRADIYEMKSQRFLKIGTYYL